MRVVVCRAARIVALADGKGGGRGGGTGAAAPCTRCWLENILPAKCVF